MKLTSFSPLCRWACSLVVALVVLANSSLVLASPTLRMNSQGKDVVILQQKLQNLGYRITNVDGIFGYETEQAVAEFQRDHKIQITGVVSNSTWRVLKSTPDKKKPASTTKNSGNKNTNNNGSLPNLPTYNAPNGQQILPASKVPSIIAEAKRQIGVPYSFGGTTPKGFDCSGFVQYVFARNGIIVPRLADDQYKLGKRSATSLLVPGDLVFFTTYEPGPSHCGIYLGNNNFIHASSSRGIRVDSLNNEYWKPRFLGGKHIVI